MEPIAKIKKWLKGKNKDEYCRNLERCLSSQTTMTYALMAQLQLFRDELGFYTRGFRKKKRSAALCQEMIETLDNIVCRFEQ